MKRYRICLFLTLFVSLLSPQAEAFIEQGRWSHFADPENSVCRLVLEDVEHTQITIDSVAQKSTFYFTLRNAAWKSLKTDSDMRIVATFHDKKGEITDMWRLSTATSSVADGGPSIKFETKPAANDGADFSKQFRSASELWFWRDEVRIASFDLSGSSAAMDKLEICRSLIRTSPDFDPFSDKN